MLKTQLCNKVLGVRRMSGISYGAALIAVSNMLHLDKEFERQGNAPKGAKPKYQIVKHPKFGWCIHVLWMEYDGSTQR